MKTLPIPFSDTMILALRAGRKTQTRRITDDPTGKCPYGGPGQNLWVREKLRHTTGELYDRTIYSATGDFVPFAKPFAAGRMDIIGWHGTAVWPWQVNVIAPRYCPRWASRTTLEVVSVRAERVQDISEEDAKAEGVESNHPSGGRREDEPETWRNYMSGDEGFPATTARESFQTLWESINGVESWQANSFVWRVEFRVLSESI